MAMRGDDIVAVHVDKKKIAILKGEAKSNASLSSGTVKAARKALQSHNSRPSPHTLSFLADRFFEMGETELADRIDDAQLSEGLKLDQVTHMLFTFSGNDPSALLTTDLTDYPGRVKQHSVGVHVKSHQAFISDVYSKVIADGVDD